MRKIYSLLIVLVLLISVSSIVLAHDDGNHYGKDDDFKGDDNHNKSDDQDENETKGDIDDDRNESDDHQNETDDQDENENETEKEIIIVNNSLGAEIRLLQLEKALLKNILKGEMAVQVLIGLNFTTTKLESILTKMKTLLLEVRTVNTSSNESVQKFIFLKNESKNLTTQFRETIRGLLNDTSLREIRERIREKFNESGELQNCSKRTRNLIRQFNFNQLYRLYGIIGEANSSFVNDYFNGTLSLNETKLQLCKIINNMTKEKKYEIFSEIKGENIRRQIHAQDAIEHMGNHGHGKQ